MHAGSESSKTNSDDSFSYKVVRCCEGLIRIKIESCFYGVNEQIRRFLYNAVSMTDITKVKFSTTTESILIHYVPERFGPQGMVKQLMDNSREQEPESEIKQYFEVILSYAAKRKKKGLKLLKMNRYGKLVTTWKMESDLKGRLRLSNRFLLHNKGLEQRIDAELMKINEITKCNVCLMTGSILIRYQDPRFKRNDLIIELDKILIQYIQSPEDQIQEDHQLELSSFSLGIALLAETGVPWLIPFSILLTLYTARPIFERAIKAAIQQRAIKVDILDALVIILSLAYRQLSSAGLMVCILDAADRLMKKTTDRSRKHLIQIFGRQARFAYVLKDGDEVQVPVEALKINDIVCLQTGEQIPVDGVVVTGGAMIDQHNLTGESAPVECGEGDEVFASTVLLAGKLHVRALKTGADTTASRIIEVISIASTHKVKFQSMGERMADRMVIPTLGMGALGFLLAGPNALMGILNADYGTGIRVAAPVAMLSHLALAAKHGVLIKEGHVLEHLKEMDVVLFDKTGTLTREVPEVSRIVPAHESFREKEILLYAAAAEQRFSHPIARAFLEKAEQQGLKLPPKNASYYHVGLGIEVGIDDQMIKVGSLRYMEKEKISLPEVIQKELMATQEQGKSSILVAVNEKLAGMIELQSSSRPEASRVIDNLRKRGIKEIVLISGDHDAPTRSLAEKLRVNRYFSGVLPHEKADYVKRLQKEGKKVMMVGDGINDSIAISCADIGVSLQGASTFTMDEADVIFMDGDLRKFDYLFDISEAFNRNITRSFLMILIPNTICIAGALLRICGLSASLILNNGFNILATVNGMLPSLGSTSKFGSLPIRKLH